MTGLLDIDGHLAFYRSYHFNKVNVSIHLVCIPVILLTATMLMTPLNVYGLNHPIINLGSILTWSYGMFYVLLDASLGVPSFLFLTAFSYAVTKLYVQLSPESQSLYITWALFGHIVAWLLQFYGHGVHEKRAPALLDNLLQALVLAPFFVVYEIAFALGFKLDTKRKMDNRAGQLVKDFRASRTKTKEPKHTRR